MRKEKKKEMKTKGNERKTKNKNKKKKQKTKNKKKKQNKTKKQKNKKQKTNKNKNKQKPVTQQILMERFIPSGDRLLDITELRHRQFNRVLLDKEEELIFEYDQNNLFFYALDNKEYCLFQCCFSKFERPLQHIKRLMRYLCFNYSIHTTPKGDSIVSQFIEYRKKIQRAATNNIAKIARKSKAEQLQSKNETSQNAEENNNAGTFTKYCVLFVRDGTSSLVCTKNKTKQKKKTKKNKSKNNKTKAKTIKQKQKQ